MKRIAKSGLIPAPQNLGGNVHRRVFNRLAPQRTDDWFRIENSTTTAESGSVTKIYIYDEIGFWGTTASDFVKQLLDISTEEIHLHLNSPGGNVFDGIAIYNGLKMHDAKVTTFVDALAASAASFIAQAGDSVVMARNAQMMIHDASGVAFGNAADMRDLADLLDKLSNNIADIYAYNAGGSTEEWRALMQAETWYSAKEAVDAGLATQMLDTEDKNAEQAKNKWDLSIFNHAGREHAPSPEEVREKVLITNRIKEAPVAKPTGVQNNNGDPEQGTPAAAPEGQPEEQSAPASPPEQPTAPAAPAEEEQQQAPDQGGDPASTQPSNSAAGFSVLVNGTRVADMQAIQNHINGLELFRKETLENARKTFVENLAKDNKIAATQIDKTTEFALDLTNEQYEKWVSSWDAAGPISMLGSHTPNASDTASSEEQAKEDEINLYRDTVNHHKMGGMPIDKIKETDSYKNLVALVPDFKL